MVHFTLLTLFFLTSMEKRMDGCIVILGDSPRVIAGFERVFLINYERERLGAEKSDDELKPINSGTL